MPTSAKGRSPAVSDAGRTRNGERIASASAVHAVIFTVPSLLVVVLSTRPRASAPLPRTPSTPAHDVYDRPPSVASVGNASFRPRWNAIAWRDCATTAAGTSDDRTETSRVRDKVVGRMVSLPRMRSRPQRRRADAQVDTWLARCAAVTYRRLDPVRRYGCHPGGTRGRPKGGTKKLRAPQMRSAEHVMP